MAKTRTRPVIQIQTYYNGGATIYEAFGKVYAGIFRDKLHAAPSAHLKEGREIPKLKSS